MGEDLKAWLALYTQTWAQTNLYLLTTPRAPVERLARDTHIAEVREEAAQLVRDESEDARAVVRGEVVRGGLGEGGRWGRGGVDATYNVNKQFFS